MEPHYHGADGDAVKERPDGVDPQVDTVTVTLAALTPAELGRPKYPRIAHDRAEDAATAADGASLSRVWRWTVAVQGTCRRASTTAADRRRDALFTATRFIETAKRIVRFERTRLGATISHAPCGPATAEAPGDHVLCLELRDTDPATIGRIYERLVAEAWTIGRLSSSTFAFTPHAGNPTVLYDVPEQPGVTAPHPAMLPGRLTTALAIETAQGTRTG